MRRRDILKTTAASGILAIVGEPSEALATPEQDPATVAVGLAFVWVWENVVTKEAKDELRATVTDICAAIHRKVDSVIGRGSIGGKVARITIRIGQHADGRATMGGHLHNMSGSGAHHVTHSGHAPHHRHQSLHSHIKQLVSKSHVWLVQNKM